MCNYTDYVLNLNRPLDTSVVYDAVCQTIIYYTAEFSFGYSVYRLRHLLISQALLGDLYCFINGGAPKYSVSLIIPKSDTATINKIKAAIQAAYEEGQSKLKGNGKSVPALSAIKTPLRDGDLERPDDEAYKNSYFINANSATAPGIVDADRNPILERSEVYSGVYGRASINLYAFNSNGNKGIACGLNNLQKIRDGEPLGGKSKAEDDFATVDDEDDFLD